MGILINTKYIMCYFNFLSLLFDDVFLLQRKLKCRDLKRENNHTCCCKVQKQMTSLETQLLFVWDEKCYEETFRLVET